MTNAYILYREQLTQDKRKNSVRGGGGDANIVVKM